MKYVLFLNLLLWGLAGPTVQAQDTTRRVLLGIDLSKNVPALPFLNNYRYFFERGFLVEFPAYVPLGTSRSSLKITPGYCNIAANPVYRNLDYHNRGFLLKAGVDYFRSRRISVGGGINAAAYDEFGTFVLSGPFFGDLRMPFRRRVFGLGLEGHWARWWYLGPRFFISPELRFVIYAMWPGKSPEPYYIPGMGATSRDMPFTGGLSVRFGYAVAERR
jgi:hypothetical protein